MIKKHIKQLVYRAPEKLRRNQIAHTQVRIERVLRALECYYFQGWRAKETMSATAYTKDLADHLTDRLDLDRIRAVPWLDNAAPLRGASILEIGCGTGASTVAMAEQGARVTGIDGEAESIEVARARCDAYGVRASFLTGNAVDLLKETRANTFSMILFFACLEHMTHEERMESLRLAWDLLPPNGTLGVLDTPNRLWYVDTHTSLLPFFHWLPNDLAFEYSQFSQREVFNSTYKNKSLQMEHFLRRGRGVSFHEFDLAIGKDNAHRVLSCLSDFHRVASQIRRSHRDRRHTRVLRASCPDIHHAWYHESLDLLLIKAPR